MYVDRYAYVAPVATKPVRTGVLSKRDPLRIAKRDGGMDRPELSRTPKSHEPHFAERFFVSNTGGFR